jgi:hypothetical protein
MNLVVRKINIARVFLKKQAVAVTNQGTVTLWPLLSKYYSETCL